MHVRVGEGGCGGARSIYLCSPCGSARLVVGYVKHQQIAAVQASGEKIEVI